jgi:hypothetical protein
MNWEKVFEAASRITSPIAAAVFCACLAAAVITFAKSKDKVVLRILACSILLLGCLPVTAHLIVATRGIYHVQIQVLGIDGQPAADAKVTASVLGTVKQSNQNFEFDLYPQAKPIDDEVTFFAVAPEAYLAGSNSLKLKGNYYPTVTIRLKALPFVEVRGTVVDQHGSSVPGATVSVVGYQDSTKTDANGNFVIPSHHARGQSLSVRIEKGRENSETMQIAGAGEIQIVLVRKRS